MSPTLIRVYQKRLPRLIVDGDAGGDVGGGETDASDGKFQGVHAPVGNEQAVFVEEQHAFTGRSVVEIDAGNAPDGKALLARKAFDGFAV